WRAHHDQMTGVFRDGGNMDLRARRRRSSYATGTDARRPERIPRPRRPTSPTAGCSAWRTRPSIIADGTIFRACPPRKPRRARPRRRRTPGATTARNITVGAAPATAAVRERRCARSTCWRSTTTRRSRRSRRRTADWPRPTTPIWPPATRKPRCASRRSRPRTRFCARRRRGARGPGI
ncbi:MAG: DnaJ-class molecular chaperone, partial [uncultured Sphingomonadaceae bacterium]